MMEAWMFSMHAGLAATAVVSIACRLHHMSKQTRTSVRVQHALLMAGVLWSLAVPSQYAVLPVLASLVAWLLLSAPRWRHGAPDDTTRPGELDDRALRQVAGGVRRER